MENKPGKILNVYITEGLFDIKNVALMSHTVIYFDPAHAII